MDDPFIGTLYKSDDERIEIDLPPLVYIVMPKAWPEALKPARPSPLRPGQAKPDVGLMRA